SPSRTSRSRSSTMRLPPIVRPRPSVRSTAVPIAPPWRRGCAGCPGGGPAVPGDGTTGPGGSALVARGGRRGDRFGVEGLDQLRLAVDQVDLEHGLEHRVVLGADGLLALRGVEG